MRTTTRIVDAYHRIVPTPPEHRLWIDERSALTVLGCDADELAALKEAGLATSDAGLERFDVWNIGFAEAAQRSRGERELIFFNRLLRSYGGDWTSGFDYDVTAVAECPAGAGCSSTSWPSASEVPGVDWQGHETAPGRVEWRGQVTMRGRAAQVRSPRIAAVWDAVLATYGFQFTALSLASDVDQTRARRVGDCTALSLLIVDELRRDGYEALVRSGYIFGGARTRWHRWVEVVDDDGQTKYLDPSMAMLADRFFTPRYAEYCFGSLLNRVIPVDTDDQFYVGHDCALTDERAYVDISLQPR